MTPGTRGDGLRLQLSGVDVSSLKCSGTLAGCIVLGVGAANGVGAGTLSATAAALSWQAPGDGSPGPVVPINGDGQYLLESSTPGAWISLQVYAAYLPTSGGATITLSDQYNAVGPSDVSAAQATSGQTLTTTYTLKNYSGNTIQNVTLWLDSTVSGFAELSVSGDNVNFYTPTSSGDVHALAWSSIAAGASVTFYVKRVTAASASSNPGILNALDWAWTGY